MVEIDNFPLDDGDEEAHVDGYHDEYVDAHRERSGADQLPDEAAARPRSLRMAVH